MSFTAVHHRAWLSEQDCDLASFRALVERTTDPADYPHAAAVERNVLLYDAERVRGAKDRREVQEELVRALTDGPGVVVFQGAFPDHAVVDRFTAVFDSLIREQYAAGTTAGDHFAKPGANERVWNALEKAALYDPAAFADYYANPVVALVSEAWLGPGYQVTSQVNVVNPGGLAQTAHRDYHLGFLSDEAAAAYPAHVHRLSPVLTLQGAVAHCDMPVESGPTLYLPFSQRFEPGYLAWRRPEFQAYFKEHHVQLPLSKGDAVFFNPALLRRKTEGADAEWLDHVIAASAEGYPFPTNLDSDPPVDGLAPPSQADLVRRALAEGWTPRTLRDELRAGADRRTS